MAISGGVMAAGALTSAAGSYGQAKSQQQSLDYQASVAQNNAAIAQTQASITQDNGQVSAMDQGLKANNIYGAQRAQFAANGVDLGSGSANNVLATTKFMNARDTAQIQDNAMRQAWGYKVQSADDTSNANALSSMASNINPTNAAFTSLLGSAGKVNGSWNTYAAANGQDSSGKMLSNLLS